jgi:hypothetical protein
MNLNPALAVIVVLLCGCSPGAKNPSVPAGVAPQRAPAAVAAMPIRAPAPVQQAPSYEVSIASAEADRVHARDVCDSTPKPERNRCLQAAETAYDRAKSAAENTPDPPQ